MKADTKPNSDHPAAILAVAITVAIERGTLPQIPMLPREEICERLGIPLDICPP